MPQDVYGPEADEEHAPVHDSDAGQTTPAGDPTDPRGDALSEPRGEDNGDDDLGNVRNGEAGESGADATTKTGGNDVPNPDELSKSEENPDQSEESPDKSEADAGAKGSFSFNALGDKLGSLQKTRNRLRSSFKSKWVLLAGALSGMIIAIIAILILFIGLLKIPDLAQNITAYQFNRITRDYAESAQNVVSEDLAVQAADDGVIAQLQAKYQTLRDNTWGRFDNLRPKIIIDNLGADNNLKLNYKPGGLFSGQRLAGITLNNKTYLVKDVAGPWRYIPGINTVLRVQNEIEFSNAFFPALNANMQLDTVGPLIRGVVENRIRQEAGISLTAWVVSKYQGDSPTDAELQQARDAYAAIDQEQQASRIPVTQDLRDATNSVDQETASTVASNSKLLQLLNKGGVSPAVSATLQSTLSSNILGKALGVINPIVGVGMPVCIIYDSSLENSGPTIDEQTTEEERAYYYLQSAADQEKYGKTTGEAVGALNNQMGDITIANAEVRANGGIVDTTNTLSTEASPSGQYTIFNVVGGSGFAGPINGTLNATCPYITNTGVIIGLTVTQLLAALATGGTSEGVVEGANTAAESTLGSFAQNILSRFASQGVGKAGGKIGDVITNTVGTGAKIAGASIAAKLTVLASAGTLHDGLETATDLTNESDAGGNFTAQQLEQQMLYGRPLTACEVSAGNAVSRGQLAAQVEGESMYARYADIMNPNSLANKLAINISGLTKPSIVSSLINFGSDFLEPVKSLAGLFTSLSPGTAFAAGGCGNDDSTDYGNVQFGWPQSEENLIKSSPTYQLLENQSILEQSGKEDAIASEYGKCFTDSIGTLLTGSDNGGNPEIVRDGYGNVLDQGLCSPTNLGPSNPTYGDLVFRWRLANRYSNVLDQLNNEQSNNDSTEQTTSATGAGQAI